jgi:WD40 repeat protein
VLEIPYKYDFSAYVLPVWNQDNRRMAILTHAGIVVFDIHSKTSQILVENRQNLRSMAWSPHGETLLLAYDELDKQVLWGVADSKELWCISVGETAIDHIVWSPDGKYVALLGDQLVVCDGHSGIVMWRWSETHTRQDSRISNQVIQKQIHVVEHVNSTEEIRCPLDVQWSNDSRYLAVCWERMSLFRVYHSHNGQVKTEGNTPSNLLRWSAEGEPMFEEHDYRLETCIPRWNDPFTRTLTLSPDGRLLAAEGDQHRLWIQDNNRIQWFPGHPRTILAMQWSGKNVLATTCRDGWVRRFSLLDGDSQDGSVRGEGGIYGKIEDWVHVDPRCEALVWSPNGEWLVLCCSDKLYVISYP